jgi:alpha-amylase/alpha-mannosidase (GH57 family)
MTADAIAIHGHVYQPPRADPRTGVVPVEPTAAPFHDWNERITAECYRPNAFARIYDERGRIVRIVNNYELMSFDLGPTLAHWLDAHAPDVLARIVEGDQRGRTAISHPFHHSILPLCHPEDARTELRWGAADFRHRFGREPEGTWLPETGVDAWVLDLLAAEGYDFTVLAPSQVATPVPAGAVGEWRAPSGRIVDLVVYDGPTSHDVAFGGALHDTGALIDRLIGGAEAGLVVAATDAETFGHHHQFTERAIAHALGIEAAARGIRSGGLGALREWAPRVPVADVWPSAWSCAHGLGRWRRDCGCSGDGQPGWHQRWREPLRDALVLLRSHAVGAFAHRGADVFHDPWEARDAFGAVLADAGEWDRFVEAHVRPAASEAVARALLDSQEATLASFTSCAWFFADLARREVAIVLQEALRSIELLRALGEEPPLELALDLLALAESNDPDLPTGREVWAWATEAPLDTGWTPIVRRPLDQVLDDLVDRSLAGDIMAQAQAIELVGLMINRDGPASCDRAQERVYATITSDGAARKRLGPLGEALGLAVSALP